MSLPQPPHPRPFTSLQHERIDMVAPNIGPHFSTSLYRFLDRLTDLAVDKQGPGPAIVKPREGVESANLLGCRCLAEVLERGATHAAEAEEDGGSCLGVLRSLASTDLLRQMIAVLDLETRTRADSADSDDDPPRLPSTMPTMVREVSPFVSLCLPVSSCVSLSPCVSLCPCVWWSRASRRSFVHHQLPSRVVLGVGDAGGGADPDRRDQAGAGGGGGSHVAPLAPLAPTVTPIAPGRPHDQVAHAA